jgi:hypothetical protein
MKRKHLTETPVCPRERLVIISYTTGLYFAKERIGPLAAIITTVFYLLALYLFALPNTPENPFASIYSETLIKPLVNTLCSSLGSTLLFIESTTIHPLYLWVIKGLVSVGSGGLVTGVQVSEVHPCGSGADRLRTCGSFSRGRRVSLALGLLSGGSLWWMRWRLAAGATMWVLVGSPGCVGSGMSCVGGIRGVGVFVLLPRSWRPLPQYTLISPLRL